MNGRHLPAGQGMQQDLGRRRPYGHQAQPYPPAAPLYNAYMHPYNANYYHPQPLPPQYYNNGLTQQYNPYQHYGRSPPPMMTHYTHPPPPPLQPQAPPFVRPQPSPAIAASHPPVIASSYQPAPAPPLPQTPSSFSTQSSNTLSAGPLTPPTPQIQPVAQSPPPAPKHYIPFQAPVCYTLKTHYSIADIKLVALDIPQHYCTLADQTAPEKEAESRVVYESRGASKSRQGC